MRLTHHADQRRIQRRLPTHILATICAFGSARHSKGAVMLATPLLRSMIERHLTEEALHLPSAIWLPLGPKAEAAVMHMVRMGHLRPDRVLNGMPHPSGANAERVAVFLGKKDPAAASRQTNPAPLIAAFSRMKTQISLLEGEAA